MTASGLGRRFGARWIFRRIEFELEPGNALFVLGPNGSGKSTLLRILAGLLAASEGSVDPKPSESRASVGYAALDLALYPHLNAAEHLDLAARLLGVPAAGPELLEEVGLGDAGGKLAGQFSSGMRARLKLALALQHSPRVLLLDEPSASLDTDGRALVEAAIERQLQHGAVVVATNDPGDRRLATHALTLG